MFNDYYFLQKREIFLADHFPDDPIWQLSDTLITEAQFATEWKGRTTTHNIIPSHTDTISNWLKLSEDDKELSKIRRIMRYNPSNLYGLYFSFIECTVRIGLDVDSIETQIIHRFTQDTLARNIIETQINRLQYNLLLVNNYYQRLIAILPQEDMKDWKENHTMLNMPLIKASIDFFRYQLELQEMLVYEKKVAHTNIENVADSYALLANHMQVIRKKVNLIYCGQSEMS